MMFNSDASKQTQNIIFSRKARATKYGTIYSNNVPVIREKIHKYLALFLNPKLNFLDHINKKNKKGTKGVDVIRKMNLILTCSFLLKYINHLPDLISTAAI